MSDHRNNEMVRIGDQLSKTDTEILLPEQREALLASVRQMMKEDVRSLSEIRPLLKTEETMNHSLGELYDFLCSEKRCSQCSGRLSSCTQSVKGYRTAIEYDRDFDEIRAHRTPCDLERKRMEVLNRILPCDRNRLAIYQDMSSLVKSILSDEGYQSMKDTTRAYSMISKEIKAIKEGKEVPSHAFFCINGISLPNALLAYASYLSSMNGLKVSYLDCNLFFKALGSYDEEERRIAERDFRMASTSQVLLLQDLSSLPYLTKENAKKYLFGLFRERAKKGYVTYVSLSSSFEPKSILKRSLSGLDCQDEGIRIAAEHFPLFLIHDLDIR